MRCIPFVAIAVGVAGGCTVAEPLYCDKDSDCDPGYWCDEPIRTCRNKEDAGQKDGQSSEGDKQKQLGAACTKDTECASGHCADNHCCAVSCAGSDPICRGSCDSKGACTFPDSTKSCGATSCKADKLTTYGCDGKGGCTFTASDCGKYACDDTGAACRTACTTDSHCTSPAVCVSGKCLRWTVVPSGVKVWLRDIWGGFDTSIWAVGDQGKLLHFQGKTWKDTPSGTTMALDGIWGRNSSDVWIVGEKGTLLNNKGTGVWKKVSSGTTEDLTDIWGTGFKVWAVGTAGAIIHIADDVVTKQSAGTTLTLDAVWGSSSQDVWAVGDDGAMTHYDGTKWTYKNYGKAIFFRTLWGSAKNNYWAAGYDTFAHFTGAWTEVPGVLTKEYLYGIWGASASDVWGAGENGKMLRYQGGSWKQVATGVKWTFTAVWGLSATDVWAVGDQGTIIHLE